MKLGSENLKMTREDKVFVASHVSIVNIYIGDIYIFMVGKDV